MTLPPAGTALAPPTDGGGGIEAVVPTAALSGRGGSGGGSQYEVENGSMLVQFSVASGIEC